jgi:putative phosphoesterase
LRIVVVSDTHGNLKGFRQVLRRILAGGSADLFIHLGDDYEDAEVLDEFGCTYLRVPGVYSHYYADRSVPNRTVQELAGWRVLLSHTDVSHANDLNDDPRPERLVAKKEIDVILYGHSHVPVLEAKDGILFVNPGHLKNEDKKGHKPSYAILDLRPDYIDAKITDARNQEVLQEVRFRKNLIGSY